MCLVVSPEARCRAPLPLTALCLCPALLYELKVPRWDFQTGRQLRTSPLYDRLDTQGARWMEKHGFERPKYFVPPGKGTKRPLTQGI